MPHIVVTEMKPVQRNVEIDRIEVMVTPFPHLDCSACGKDCVEGKPMAIAWGESRGWRVCHRCIPSDLEDEWHREQLDELAPTGVDFL